MPAAIRTNREVYVDRLFENNFRPLTFMYVAIFIILQILLMAPHPASNLCGHNASILGT